MGGGSVMRTAAKFAKVAGPSNGGLRGVALPEASETSVAARVAAVRSASAAVDDSSKLGMSTEKVEQPFEAVPAWDLNDWVIEGEEFIVDKISTKTTPRIVFGLVPSFDEAKEAICDLRDGLKMYISGPTSSRSKESFAAGQERSETELSLVTSVPNQVSQAFKILEDPVVQDDVASMVSDPIVWNAFMKNKTFLKYFPSQESSAAAECEEPLVVETSDCKTRFVGEADCEGLPSNSNPIVTEFEDLSSGTVNEVPPPVEVNNNYEKVSGDETADQPSKPEKPVLEFMDNMKVTIKGMVDNFNSFFQDLFAGSSKKTSTPGESSAQGGFPASIDIGGFIMGLAMMVIMVVAMKRG